MNILSIRALLTPDFLEKLAEVVKHYGWAGDYFELTRFVRECYGIAGIDPPNLDPYQPEEP